jgi:hypothetical protein
VDLPFEHGDHWTYPAGVRPERDEEDWNKRSHLLISALSEVVESFCTAYKEDPYFRDRYVEEVPNPNKLLTPSRFQKGHDGLLYFVDADWKTRLCVPRTKVKWVMRWIHESLHESAHAGPFKFMSRLRELFFWTSLTKDAEEFATMCDVCQKIKVDHRKKMGGLCPRSHSSSPIRHRISGPDHGPASVGRQEVHRHSGYCRQTFSFRSHYFYPQ